VCVCVCRRHEDIDALFAKIRNAIIKKSIHTVDQLVEFIKKAFTKFSLPVKFCHVDGTLDYTGFFAPHVDKNLAHYG
jgi:hypothetical protein